MYKSFVLEDGEIFRQARLKLTPIGSCCRLWSSSLCFPFHLSSVYTSKKLQKPWPALCWSSWLEKPTLCFPSGECLNMKDNVWLWRWWPYVDYIFAVDSDGKLLSFISCSFYPAEAHSSILTDLGAEGPRKGYRFFDNWMTIQVEPEPSQYPISKPQKKDIWYLYIYILKLVVTFNFEKTYGFSWYGPYMIPELFAHLTGRSRFFINMAGTFW